MSRLVFRRVASHLLRSAFQPPSDAELLNRFAASRDETAFAELVARHSVMVRGTARRCLGDGHAAEDVCQAAFLVLAGKAGTIRWGATVGPWLHATTVRLARKALSRRGITSRTTPGQVPAAVPSPAADPPTQVAWAEIYGALDQELAALPEVLRGPLVLCYLQGHTRDEAAQALGCSLAKLKRRLERARDVLRERLTRRGITLPAAGLAILACDLPVGAATVSTTTHAAVAFATSGAVSPAAAGLLDVSRAGFRAKVLALMVAMTLVASGAIAAFSGSADEKPAAPNEPPGSAPKADETVKADVPSEALPPSAIARLGSSRLRTGGTIERLAFSPDGTKLASWSTHLHTNDVLTIWDTKTGQALRRVDLPGARIERLVWLADGRGIALVKSSWDDPAPLVWEFTDEKAAKPELKPRERGGKVVVVPAVPQDDEHDSCYAVSPDGKTIAVGKSGKLDLAREVRLCELKTGAKIDALKRLKEFATHPTNCGHMYFAPDGKTLVVFGVPKYIGDPNINDGTYEKDQVVTVWDVATGKVRCDPYRAPRPNSNGTRYAVALSNTALALGLDSGDTSLWDLTTGKERVIKTGHGGTKYTYGTSDGVGSVAFTPDGKTLVTGGRDKRVCVWDVASGKQLHKLNGHSTEVEVMAAAPGGKLVASAGQDGLIRLWDVATGADACPLPGHKYAVWDVVLSPDGKTAITGGWDDTIRWWDATTGAERRSVPVDCRALTRSPDGKTVLGTTYDGKLRMWDGATGRANPADLPADARFESLCFTPDGKQLVVAVGAKVTVWEWPALKLARTVEPPAPPAGFENRCQVVAVSPNGKWLAVIIARHAVGQDGRGEHTATDGVVEVFDFATGKHSFRFVETGGPVGSYVSFRSGTFTPDGRFLLIGHWGGVIPGADGYEGGRFNGAMNLLDVGKRKWVRGFEFPAQAATVSVQQLGATTLSPDGRTLYAAYNTGEIVAYEVATGAIRRTLTGHRGHIGGLAVSADGRRLLSGSHDCTALVWDVTLAGGATPPAKPLTETEADKLWEVVARTDTKTAFNAMAALANSPESAVEVVQKHIKPAPPAPTEAVLDRLLTDLGSEDFDTREKASKELNGYGELALPGVRKRLDKAPSAEARARAVALLKKFESLTPSVDRVRQMRAVELLEGLGTPAARKLLTELAEGAAGAPLSLDAGAALKRLGPP